jgi:hypothetical protein
LIAAGLLALLVVRVVPATAATPSAPAPAAAAVSSTATPPSAPAEAVVGEGFWAKLGCVGCAAAILAAGGTSLVGLAIIAGLYPEAVAGCAVGCIAAFS